MEKLNYYLNMGLILVLQLIMEKMLLILLINILKILKNCCLNILKQH